MGVLARLFRLIWGEEVDRSLRPVLAVNISSSLAGSTLWSFMGIWAIDRLRAEEQLPWVYGVGAVLAAAAGYTAGHLSDRRGRRSILLGAQAVFAVYPLVLLAVGSSLTAGVIALVFAGGVGSAAGTMSQAIITDLVPQERHEEAFAAARIASNLGVVSGPPLGALLLGVGGWTVLFVGVSVLTATAWGIAWRLVPRGGRYAPREAPTRGSLAVIARDRAFLVFLGSAVFAWIVYVSYEVALPISLFDGHGYSRWSWGLIVVLNPILVTLLQMRLTRATLDWPAAPKLMGAMLLMGMPFLALTQSAAVAVVVAIVVVFVFGEMLWVPTSQAIVTRLAPDDLRGAYLGAFGSGPAVGFALSPLLGLSLRNAAGDDAMWMFYAAVSVVAAILGGLACYGVRRLVAGAPA